MKTFDELKKELGSMADLAPSVIDQWHRLLAEEWGNRNENAYRMPDEGTPDYERRRIIVHRMNDEQVDKLFGLLVEKESSEELEQSRKVMTQILKEPEPAEFDDRERHFDRAVASLMHLVGLNAPDPIIRNAVASVVRTQPPE